ncbi:hypothetical protein B0H13DRAFT_1875416 [Mycena leptocephala]|nr:hypothetical protein B0H13DRAFT_1875416 [Mycena leptocephala]
MPTGQPSTANPDESFCSTCSLWKLATDEFFNIKLGKCPKTCCICNQRKKEKNKDKPRDSTATGQSYPTDGGNADEDLSDLPQVTLEEFLAIIAMDENARSFAALVDTQILKSNGRSLADNIALEVLHCVGYTLIIYSRQNENLTAQASKLASRFGRQSRDNGRRHPRLCT